MQACLCPNMKTAILAKHSGLQVLQGDFQLTGQGVSA